MFGREIRNLIIILLVFDLSCTLRLFADSLLLEWNILPMKMLKYDCHDAND